MEGYVVYDGIVHIIIYYDVQCSYSTLIGVEELHG